MLRGYCSGEKEKRPHRCQQDLRLSIAWRQRLKSVGEARAIVTRDGKLFGCWARGPMQLFVELGHVFHEAILLQMGVTGVPHDLM